MGERGMNTWILIAAAAANVIAIDKVRKEIERRKRTGEWTDS